MLYVGVKKITTRIYYNIISDKLGEKPLVFSFYKLVFSVLAVLHYYLFSKEKRLILIEIIIQNDQYHQSRSEVTYLLLKVTVRKEQVDR